ncbi:uncharacterized protein [Tursiops truncatus]|uniref:uncharacterized protein n=1 Tax=Tursiops truncatus TaxID=9739 RepID=UPI003CCF2B98
MKLDVPAPRVTKWTQVSVTPYPTRGDGTTRLPWGNNLHFINGQENRLDRFSRGVSPSGCKSPQPAHRKPSSWQRSLVPPHHFVPPTALYACGQPGFDWSICPSLWETFRATRLWNSYLNLWRGEFVRWYYPRFTNEEPEAQTDTCPWLSARCQQNTFQDPQQRRQRVQDPGLCLERNSVMAETTAFVLLGVKAFAVLAPVRQNQV